MSGGIRLLRDEILEHISNTYLVFRKIKKEFGFYFDGKDDVNLNDILIKKIKSICTFNIVGDSDEFPLMEELKRFKDFSIDREFFYSSKLKKGFNLLLLEYGRNRILLNYSGAHKDFEPVEEYYIADIYNKKAFTRNIYIKGKEITIINTFDAFLSFAQLNGLPQHVNTNEEFFGKFINSLSQYDEAFKNGTIQSCNDVHSLNCRYSYAVLDNVIIIIGYEEFDLDDEEIHVFSEIDFDINM